MRLSVPLNLNTPLPPQPQQHKKRILLCESDSNNLPLMVQDPELMSAFKDPEVMSALQDGTYFLAEPSIFISSKLRWTLPDYVYDSGFSFTTLKSPTAPLTQCILP